MSGAEPAEADADAPDEEEQREPTFYERVDEVLENVDLEELREEDPEDLSAEEREALEVAAVEAEHETSIDGLSDSQETHDELDRLYNDENLSLVDIGRLFRTTDATVQRRMEQHGLPRRGSRNELPEEKLLEAYVDLACELSQADDVEELAEMVEAGEAVMPTTTQMGEQGPHSAHTYYNFWDGWEDVKHAVYEHIGATPPVEAEDDDEGGDEGDDEAPDDESDEEQQGDADEGDEPEPDSDDDSDDDSDEE